MPPDFWLQLIATAGVGVGVYAAIRADLARLHERASTAKQTADEAHKRLDRHIEVAH